ncbi:MAG TPA: heparan-alpha-glucosaminide N-acetyltransferase domain-containing protein [Candidatus Binatia bacterium]
MTANAGPTVLQPAAPAPRASAAPSPLGRLVALDWMRGLVMVLMALDHSSDAFNAGRVFGDSAGSWHAGTPIAADQFFVRWVTHLCAPTFVFLAGTGLAFSVRKELSSGKTQRDVDRYMLTRGVVIAAFELWISYFVMPKGQYLFQVLYAIGTSYLLMIPLRRLGDRLALVLAVSMMLGLELVCGVLLGSYGGRPPLWAMLLFVPGNPPHLFIGYPTLHWLALMLLGWCFGSYLIRNPQTAVDLARKLLAAGGALLLCFAVVRGLDGYGNMALYRDDASVVQWLHVSKYPPSLAFDTLELGICFVLLSLLFALSATRAPRPASLLLVLGRTPMFFYLLHFPLLVTAAQLLGVEHKLGIPAAFLGATTVVAVLYPACRAYGRYKAAHKQGWARYI